MAHRLLPINIDQIRHNAEHLNTTAEAIWGSRSRNGLSLNHWGTSLMIKNSHRPQGATVSRDRLWLHLGNRLCFRRQQLGIDPHKAAAHLGVTLETFQDYESGESLIPAMQLAELAALFAVPVFYFFEDVQIGRDAPDAGQPRTDVVYAVATETERIAALVVDFQKLDFERQQHLLAFARALASDATTTRASA